MVSAVRDFATRSLRPLSPEVDKCNCDFAPLAKLQFPYEKRVAAQRFLSILTV